MGGYVTTVAGRAGIGTVGRDGLGAVTGDALVKVLSTLSEKDLELVASGVDPEGGTVPAEIVALAKEEVRRRRAAPVPGARAPVVAKGSALKFIVGGVVVLGGLWWLTRGASEGGEG